MNKDDLIKLREQLLKIRKSEAHQKYTPAIFEGFSNGIISVEPFDDDCKTKEEIMDEYDPMINEENALNYFETKVEEIIRNATLHGVDFDGIMIYMYVHYFINDNMSKAIDDNCHLLKEKFNRKDILDDYVNILFDFNFTNKNDAEIYLNNPNEVISKEFLIHYGRFISLLSSRGFEVNDRTFNESLQRNLNGEYSKITINLVKDNKKQK